MVGENTEQKQTNIKSSKPRTQMYVMQGMCAPQTQNSNRLSTNYFPIVHTNNFSTISITKRRANQIWLRVVDLFINYLN